jgi:hypothetical protein
MASCQNCAKYETHKGPQGSSYCNGWGTGFGRNDQKSEEFHKYYKMGSKATENCPYGMSTYD